MIGGDLPQPLKIGPIKGEYPFRGLGLGAGESVQAQDCLS